MSEFNADEKAPRETGETSGIHREVAHKSGYFFEYLNEKADQIGEDEIKKVLDQFEEKVQDIKRSGVGEQVLVALQRGELFYRMLQDWWADNFSLPWRTVAAVTVALLYLINPFDLVPDFFVGIGLTDDAAMISLCWYLVEMDLRRYLSYAQLDGGPYNLSPETE